MMTMLVSYIYGIIGIVLIVFENISSGIIVIILSFIYYKLQEI